MASGGFFRLIWTANADPGKSPAVYCTSHRGPAMRYEVFFSTAARGGQRLTIDVPAGTTPADSTTLAAIQTAVAGDLGLSASDVTLISVTDGRDKATADDVKALGNAGASKEIDWNASRAQSMTLNAADCELSFVDPTDAMGRTLFITQDATGGRTITWPAGIIWAGGAEPTLTTDAGGRDCVTLRFDGATYWGACALNFA